MPTFKCFVIMPCAADFNRVYAKVQPSPAGYTVRGRPMQDPVDFLRP